MDAHGEGTAEPVRHPVLARQLQKLGLETGSVPTIDQWQGVLDRIDDAYREADRARYLSERSTELVSEEMRLLHAQALADKHHLQSLTDAIADGILGVDDSGTVVVANPAALHLLGRTKGNTVGRDVEAVLGQIEYGGGHPIAVGPLVRRHLAAREGWSFGTGVLVTEEDARHVAIGLTPMEPEHKDALATIVVRDVTAEVLADRERQRRWRLEAEVADRESQIAQAERRAVSLLENVTDIIALLSPDMTFNWASPALGRSLGYSEDDLASASLIDLVHPDDLPPVSARFGEFIEEAGATLAFDARILDHTKRYRWMEIVIDNHIGDPDLDGFVVCGRDIHRRVQHLHLLESQAEILEMISADEDLGTVLEAVARALVDAADGAVAAAVVTNDRPTRIGVASIAGAADPPADSYTWQALTSALCDEPAGADPSAVPVGRPWSEHEDQVANDGMKPAAVRPLVRPDGSIDAVLTVYVSADDAVDSIAVPDLLVNTVYLALTHNRRRLKLERRATQDPLTGLPNRWQIRVHLQRVLAAIRRGSSTAAVLFVDLDDLKRVNDSLGHETGDLVLKMMADRLRRSVRDVDLLCRFGGDEFVVVCENFDDGHDAVWVAERVLEALREPMEISGMTSVVTASIGIAHVGPNYEEADEILRDADAAMYRAKEAGRDRYAVFDDVLRTRAMRRIDVETGLRSALKSGRIVAHYQPQFRPDTGEIVGVEALARWNHPDRGLLTPAEWIEVAEKSGLIGPIGEQILDQTCGLAARLDEASPSDTRIRLSVNVAASQLGQPGLVSQVVAALDRTDLAPDRLCLELTESSLADLTDPIGALAELKTLGLRLSVDDWGTGYSSLEYLRLLPVDELKVDRNFVQGLDEPDGIKLVRGICQLGRALDLDLVAEGVETGAQLGHVRAFRFDLVQGFLLARPMPADELIELIGAGPVGISPFARRSAATG